MAVLPFNAKFTPTACQQVSTYEFDVHANIFDGLGFYSAFDVKVNDLVYLDCFVSISAPGTVSKYVVTQIHNATFPEVYCRLQWADNGTVISPDEVVGTDGFISRATVNRGFAFHASPTVHTIPDYVIQYSRNIESEMLLDPFFFKFVKNGTGVAFPPFRALAWEDDGTVALGDARTSSLSDIAGINTKEILPGDFGWIIKTGYIPNALVGLNALPGNFIYLGNDGLLTLAFPPDETSDVIKLGRAEPPSGVASSAAIDLHMELEVFAEA
jgi:hypothetical protein